MKQKIKENLEFNIMIIIFLFLLFSFSFSTRISAAPESYSLQGDEILFQENSNIIQLEGAVTFSSADFKLKADRMRIDTEKKEIKAANNVEIESDSKTITGESFDYNYSKASGNLYGAEGSIGEINFSSSNLKIINASPIEAVLPEAIFTPCSRPKAHYHFKAKEIKINPDNTISIYDIVPYVAGVPVFYLPYYSVTYDPDADDSKQLQDSFPFPQFGYDQEKGVTIEFSYPYQIGNLNSGKIYYWKAGRDKKRDEKREFINKQQLTDNLFFKNRYYYLHDYDFDEEEFDEEEEEFNSALVYNKEKFNLEFGLLNDLLPEETKTFYYIDTAYQFKNGLKTGLRKEYDPEVKEITKSVYTSSYRFKNGNHLSFRQEYDSEKLIKEKYSIANNTEAIKWKLKYISGEDYNYYPYLNLSFPRFYSVKTSLGQGKVENGGVEVNKTRLQLKYNKRWQLSSNLNYKVNYSHRFDHYYGDYKQNYHYLSLNTGFSSQKQLNAKVGLSSSLFYQEQKVFGQSPLVDDREDEERFLKPALALTLKGDYPDSAWSVETNSSYDLDLEEWDEINLRFHKQEDCFDFFIGYEFIEQSINFTIEL